MTVTIRCISAAATRPLRQAVLRPQQPPDELTFPGDDEALTCHFGAFSDERLVGIASIYCEAMPGDGDGARHTAGTQAPNAADPAAAGPGEAGRPESSSGIDWRLRGMATLPEVRGSGAGGALLEACLAHIARQGGTRLWCNARVNAAGFYERYRFTTHGEPFELADIGLHYRMSRAIGHGPTG